MNYLSFKKHLIKNDAESILLFYDYILLFPPAGTFVRKFIKLINPILHLIIYTACALRINKILPQKISEKDFVTFTGKGGRFKTATDIMLRRNANNNLVIIKEYPNKNILDTELEFVSQYGDARELIRIPLYKKISEVTAEIEFIKAPTLLMQINTGKIKKNDLLPMYSAITNELDKLYGAFPANRCLIHGDLNPSNVFVVNGLFYLIDFADAHIYEKNFDKFNFLKQLLYFYFGRDRYDIIEKFFAQREIIKYSAYHLVLKKKKFYG